MEQTRQLEVGNVFLSKFVFAQYYSVSTKGRVALNPKSSLNNYLDRVRLLSINSRGVNFP
jgi:hypothetical protein